MLSSWIVRTKDQKPNLESVETVDSAIFPLLLFSSLGLRHLCCHYEFGELEPALEKDEADEIREEDEQLIEEFHILLPRVLQEWEQSTLSFWDFWIEFDEQHIRPKRENIDQEYVKAVEDLGVRIEEL